MSQPGTEPQTPCTVGRYSRKGHLDSLYYCPFGALFMQGFYQHYLVDFLPATWLHPQYICSEAQKNAENMTSIYWLQAFRGHYFMTCILHYTYIGIYMHIYVYVHVWYIKLPMYLLFIWGLVLSGFEGGLSITRGILVGAPKNLNFFGPKWYSLRTCHFRAQKSLDVKGPPPPKNAPCYG